MHDALAPQSRNAAMLLHIYHVRHANSESRRRCRALEAFDDFRPRRWARVNTHFLAVYWRHHRAAFNSRLHLRCHYELP